MQRGWQSVVLFLLVGLLWLPMGEPQADPLPMEHAVTYLTDSKDLNSSAFFVGNRGYLLTVIGKQAERQIGTAFTIHIFTGPGEVKKESAAIVDVHNPTGIVLLRLTDMSYPFVDPFITADNIGDPFSKLSEKLTIYYGKSQSSPQSTTVHVLASRDGQLKIDKDKSASRWTESMTGAPVFLQNSLIGIVANANTIYPINHVAPFVTMAESTIIGKAKIEQLILGLAQTKNLMNQKQQEKWEQFIQVADYIRTSTPLEAEIENNQIPGYGTVYSIVVKVKYPVAFMSDPELIKLTAYPEFAYLSSSSNVVPVSWREVQAKSNEQKSDGKTDKFILRAEFSAPKRDSKISTEFKPNTIKTEFAPLKNYEADRLKIVKLMVRLEWRFNGEEKDRLPHEKMIELTVPKEGS